MNFNNFDIMKAEPFSDEVDSDKGMEKKSNKKVGERREKKIAAALQGGDGSSIEVVKRPRGRPRGSKNKPKPLMIITKEAEPSSVMRPHVVEIPAGHDVAECLANFARRRKIGICVLAGSGTVANVTLRQPVAPQAVAGSAAAAVVFHGRYEILSLSATFLPPSIASESHSAAAGGVSVSLAGPQGQVVGGTVAGPLIAGGTVIVLAAGFGNPTFHRLPVEEEVTASVSISGGDDKTVMHSPPASAEGHRQKQQYHEEEQQHYYHHFHPHQTRLTAQPQTASSTAAETCGLSIYGTHFGPEIVWPATARPPPPSPF